MSANPEPEITSTDLVEQIAALVGSGQVRCEYVTGEWVRQAHGAPRMLSIALTNSDVPHWPAPKRDVVLARVAGAGVDWLRRRQRPAGGTLVSIALVRKIDLRIISWTWGVGGRDYWIDAHGTLTDQPTNEKENQ